jgi:hypothetical protein
MLLRNPHENDSWTMKKEGFEVLTAMDITLTVHWKSTDISEEHIASILSVEE